MTNGFDHVNKCPLCALTGLKSEMRKAPYTNAVDLPMYVCTKCWCLMSQDGIDKKWKELFNSAKNPDHLARFINIFKSVS